MQSRNFSGYILGLKEYFWSINYKSAATWAPYQAVPKAGA